MTHEAIFEALGDGTRRRIFEMIHGGGMAVTDIARRLPVSQPAVSQHLKVLRDAGLAEVERRGRLRIYRARPRGFEPLRAYISRFWDQALDAFEASFNTEKQEKER